MSLILLLGFILLQIKKYVCMKTPYGDLNFCRVYQGFWQLWHLSGEKNKDKKLMAYHLKFGFALKQSWKCSLCDNP